MSEAVHFLIAPFTTCMIMVAMFSYLGIHVLKREVIFIDIALAQIAAAGSTLAFVLWHAEEHSVLAYLIAFGFTILAALFFATVSKRIHQIPHEAVIGVSYAIAAAAALFMLAMATGSDVHLEEMLTGSILWTDWPQIQLCTLVFGITGLFHIIFRHRFICYSESMESSDYHEKSFMWDFLFYLTMGIVITLSVHIAGVLVIFSLLIIPATFSALFSHRWGTRLIIAYGFGLASVISGLVISYTYDFSCGPSVVSVLGGGLIIGAVYVKCKKISTPKSHAHPVQKECSPFSKEAP